jgi:hypothetical protein
VYVRNNPVSLANPSRTGGQSEEVFVKLDFTLEEKEKQSNNTLTGEDVRNIL